jgi:hypothetical protein
MKDIALAVGLTTGLVFCAAGALKLASRATFASEVRDYAVLPEALVAPVAIVLPVVELAAGAGMFIVAWRVVAAWVLLLCLAIFTAAVVLNLRRGNADVSCACFGAHSRTLDWGIVVRNAAMAAGLVAVLVTAPGDGAPAMSAVIVVVLALTCGWTLWEARALPGSAVVRS